MAIENFISEEQIRKRNIELGKQITKDYQGEEVIVIGVLTGSVIFVSDLIREIKVPLSLEFIKASSYGDSQKSSGEVQACQFATPSQRSNRQASNLQLLNVFSTIFRSLTL